MEEDDIRAWHAMPASRGEGDENLKKCWLVGAKMIQQFDEQDSESEDEDESE